MTEAFNLEILLKKKKETWKKTRDGVEWIHKASKGGHATAWCGIMDNKFNNLSLFGDRDPVPMETRSSIAERNNR